MYLTSYFSMFAEYYWTTAFLGFVTILVALYYYSVSTYGFWKAQNIPYIKPIPLFGNFFRAACGIENAIDTYRKIYYELADFKYGGFYQMRTPYLMIRDPELVNRVLVKDAEYFPGRGVYSDFKKNPMSDNLFFMDGGPKWKSIRSKLSPTFTSGKMRMMQPQIRECSGKLVRDLRRKSQEFVAGEIPVVSLLGGYSTDVISSCAFGLKINEDEQEGTTDTAFRTYGKTLFQPSTRHLLRELCLNISPRLLNMVRVPDFPEDAVRFFYRAFHDTISYRKKNNIFRNDLVDSLIRARNDLVLNDSLPPGDKFTEIQIVANAFVMFAAGFETISSTIAYCLYEISLKKHIQDRVREEIICKKSDYNGEYTYEFLSELKYMDMVFAETLRKYPPPLALFREAAQTYKVPGESLTIKKGQKIIIPFHSLHYDHKYFPDPEVFNPDRFSPEEKAKLPKGVYMPFGEGPRICIGQRFANFEMKLALAEILSNYEVEPSVKTRIPIKYGVGSFLAVPEDEIWLKFTEIY